ncbi:MAG TPA: S41 family peptidase [Streptosporangiaceae bacterium]|nr:S41 family peptidase [Streptosporangiaceae bacterium]
MTSAGYLRFPHLHQDLVTFVSEDDVWLGPVEGGRAWRVSADQTPASHPRISADGSLIAWNSTKDGQSEVYLAAADGGDQRRLTYWGDPFTRVTGWTPDGDVLAVSATGQPFGQNCWAYAIPATAPDGRQDANGRAPAGGPAAAGAHGARRLPLGPLADVAMRPGAIALLHGLGRDPAAWKRYRGGTAGRLWVAPSADGRTADGPFTRVLASLGSQLACPMVAGGRLAFLSDHEGTGNVYSCALDGTDLRRHTDHDGFYARNASTDGSRIVYHCAGDLWLLDSLDPDSQPRRLELILGSAAPGRARRVISAETHLGGLSCDYTGRGSAVEVRGTIHWLTHRDGPARALSVTSGVRARLPQVVGGTGLVAWVTDAEGEDAIEIGPVGGPLAGLAAASQNGSSTTDGHASNDKASTEQAGTEQASTGQASDPPGGGGLRRVASGAVGRVASMSASPDGKSLAVAARDGRLLVLDVASGNLTEVTASDNGEVNGLTWSTDSAWLAWSHPGPTPLRQLRMTRPGTPDIVDITDGRFIDTDPAFTLDGLYLAFLSRRNFDPVYDTHFFDLSFPYGYRPFLVPLAASTPSPFGPLIDGRPANGRDDDASKPGADPATPDSGSTGNGAATPGAGDAADSTTADATSTPGQANGDHPAQDRDTKDGKTATPVKVDTDGLAGRVIQVPVEESRYTALSAVKGGLVWLKVPVTGNLGQGGATSSDSGPRRTLQRFDLTQRRVTDLVDELDWYDVSGDGNRLLIGDSGKLTVVPADRKADADNPADRVRVDLSRARYQADPAAIWRCAYEEAGRILRHDFWIPDMAEVDWDGALAQYRPLLDRIAGPRDFSDLLYEVMGELGSSHAYVQPASSGNHGSRRPVGMLGADLDRDPDGGWRVTRILPGESSDPRALSPLAAPGAGISTGDRIMAIDGQLLGADGTGLLLAGAAGKPVELTIAPHGGGSWRRVAVTTLRDDRRLRYQDWVSGRRRAVHELGQGRVGYLHIPDMVSEGWADFHRDLRGEMIREALIVDVRGNRGGHTSQLVIEKLARRVIGWDLGRWLQAGTYPQDAPRGPIVALADEFAGSDGDIVTAAIKILDLGPVVGARTWGGVIGIDVPFHELADGTEISVPRYATWLDGYGWNVENYGVDPDVEVIPTPDEHAAGTDRQLETGVRMVIEALDATPAARAPAKSDRPSRRRPALPPRTAAQPSAAAHPPAG